MNNIKEQLNKIQSSQSGFTIIESLVAILVVSLMLVAIAPVLGVSVANRVQSKRVELAANAARAYIDGVRSGEIPAPPISETTPEQAAAVTPNGELDCDANGYCATPPPTTDYAVFCIDGNGDDNGTDGDPSCTTNSTKDMVIQAFGCQPDLGIGDDNNDGDENDDRARRGYVLGIRVYRTDAFAETIELETNENGARATASTFSSGIGRKQAPLMEMTTEIVSEEDTTYANLQARFDDNDGNGDIACKPNGN